MVRINYAAESSFAPRQVNGHAKRPQRYSEHPWEAMKTHLSNISMTEQYGGIADIAAGERSPHGGVSDYPADRVLSERNPAASGF